MLEPIFILHYAENDLSSSILIMERNGKAFSRNYWFNDDDDKIYFDWLNVEAGSRKKGIATKMLDAHLRLTEIFKLDSCLWVRKNTWMHDWYKRKGYNYVGEYEKEENAIWMIKKIEI